MTKIQAKPETPGYQDPAIRFTPEVVKKCFDAALKHVGTNIRPTHESYTSISNNINSILDRTHNESIGTFDTFVSEGILIAGARNVTLEELRHSMRAKIRTTCELLHSEIAQYQMYGGDPEPALHEISELLESIGAFSLDLPRKQVQPQKKPRGQPVKWRAIAAVIAVWVLRAMRQAGYTGEVDDKNPASRPGSKSGSVTAKICAEIISRTYNEDIGPERVAKAIAEIERDRSKGLTREEMMQAACGHIKHI
jgi:hypothetical protein